VAPRHMDDERLDLLLGDLDVVVWEADARSLAFRYVSSACQRVLQRPAAALLADPGAFAELVHPDDRAAVIAAMLAADAGTPADVTHRVESPAGPRWVRTTARAVDRGDERMLRGACIDVTPAHEELAARTDAEARFRKVVERLPAIV
jgi:PAS domain-containing protein